MGAGGVSAWRWERRASEFSLQSFVQDMTYRVKKKPAEIYLPAFVVTSRKYEALG